MVKLVLLLTAIAALGSFLLSIHVLLRRQWRYQNYMALLFLSIALWNLTIVLQGMSNSFEERLFWVKVAYPAMMSAPVFFFLLIHQFTHLHTPVSTKAVILLFLVPLLSSLMVWSPDWQHLMWQEVAWRETPYGWMALHVHGKWYYVGSFYLYALALIACFYLIRGMSRFPRLYKRIFAVLLVALVIPLFSHLLYTWNGNILFGFDPTSLSITVTSCLFFYLVSRHNILSMSPVAQNNVLDYLQDAVLLLDNSGKITDCNTKAGEMLKQLGMERCKGELFARCLSRWKELDVQLHAPERVRTPISLLNRRFLLSHNVVRNAIHENVGEILVFHDVTEVEEREQALLQLNSQLNAANELKDMLFRVVSHDLRGPVSSVTGLLEVFVERNEIPSKEVMRVLYKASAGSFYLLDDLLHWANSQRNALTLHPDYYPLCESAGRVVNLLRFQYQEKSIQVKNDCVQYITAYYDKSSLEIALRNLVSNAIKFSHPGGIIAIEGRLGNDYAILTVKDNGVGIPPDTLEQLNRDEVVQSKLGTSNEQGTGFGIQLCKALIKANHGTLSIQSTPGQGTMVTLNIPLRSMAK